MGQGSADRTTAVFADNLGQGAGAEKKTITKENLPQHEHNLQANNGDQFFASRMIAGASGDAEVTTRSGPDLNNTAGAQQLPNTGGLAGTTGQLFDVIPGHAIILDGSLKDHAKLLQLFLEVDNHSKDQDG